MRYLFQYCGTLSQAGFHQFRLEHKKNETVSVAEPGYSRVHNEWRKKKCSVQVQKIFFRWPKGYSAVSAVCENNLCLNSIFRLPCCCVGRSQLLGSQNCRVSTIYCTDIIPECIHFCNRQCSRTTYKSKLEMNISNSPYLTTLNITGTV
jgi:hypothetical protein